jgi:hypothetical protein
MERSIAEIILRLLLPFSVVDSRKIDFDVYLPTKGINLQREKVWSLLQKRELIMSILMERFIPNICTLSLVDYNDKK